MAVYLCAVCDTEYDEDSQTVRWNDLPSDWICPVCDSGKAFWRRIGAEPDTFEDTQETTKESAVSFEPQKTEDSHEIYLVDINAMAETGQSIIEPMQTKSSVIRWDDILIQGAQLSRTPLNHDDKVDTTTTIGALWLKNQ